MSSAIVTLRGQLEALLGSHVGRGMSLDHICSQLPDHSRQQVRDAIGHLVQLGLVMRNGSTRYPSYQMLPSSHRKSVCKPVSRESRHKAVIWPDGLTATVYPALQRLQKNWGGVDWSTSIQRPGCQDHLKHPSRRGDLRVLPGQLSSMCTGRLNDSRPHDPWR